MISGTLPIGCLVRIDKPALQAVIDRLKELGYRVVGPTVAQAAVVYGDLDSIEQMPIGCVDEQEAGKYRLNSPLTSPSRDAVPLTPNPSSPDYRGRGERDGYGSYFGCVIGPHSLKNYLFPPRVTLLESLQLRSDWKISTPPLPAKPLAVLGVRACDLHALRAQDKVFLEGRFVDPDYQARRQGLFILAVHCGRAVSTCFCASMKTGPAVGEGADLALFELAEHFVVEIRSERGGELMAAVPWRPCTIQEVNEAQQVPRNAEAQIQRRLDTEGIHDLLLNNLEHERWDEVADRCLACTNCTMVCPTCFCCSVTEIGDLSGDSARRERAWDSCFNDEHSYMNSGMVRRTIKARYRQWLTHKLASWIDQFGTSGCVGCGRCIAWCPVGIDLTEETAAIRG